MLFLCSSLQFQLCNALTQCFYIYSVFFTLLLNQQCWRICGHHTQNIISITLFWRKSVSPKRFRLTPKIVPIFHNKRFVGSFIPCQEPIRDINQSAWPKEAYLCQVYRSGYFLTLLFLLSRWRQSDERALFTFASPYALHITHVVLGGLLNVPEEEA